MAKNKITFAYDSRLWPTHFPTNTPAAFTTPNTVPHTISAKSWKVGVSSISFDNEPWSNFYDITPFEIWETFDNVLFSCVGFVQLPRGRYNDVESLCAAINREVASFGKANKIRWREPALVVNRNNTLMLRCGSGSETLYNAATEMGELKFINFAIKLTGTLAKMLGFDEKLCHPSKQIVGPVTSTKEPQLQLPFNFVRLRSSISDHFLMEMKRTETQYNSIHPVQYSLQADGLLAKNIRFIFTDENGQPLHRDSGNTNIALTFSEE